MLLLHRVLLDEFHPRGRVLESMRMMAHSWFVDDLNDPTALFVDLLGQRGVLLDWDDLVAVPDNRTDRYPVRGQYAECLQRCLRVVRGLLVGLESVPFPGLLPVARATLSFPFAAGRKRGDCPRVFAMR